jgi:hypothetical protein
MAAKITIEVLIMVASLVFLVLSFLSLKSSKRFLYDITMTNTDTSEMHQRAQVILKEAMVSREEAINARLEAITHLNKLKSAFRELNPSIDIGSLTIQQVVELSNNDTIKAILADNEEQVTLKAIHETIPKILRQTYTFENDKKETV